MMQRPADRSVLTGMRTTGMLHIGHYVGALQNWLKIQNSGEYECFFLLADLQAATTHPDPAARLLAVTQCVQDWLAVGLDPSLPHVHFVLQSQIQSRYEISMQLMMVAKYGELMRNPTLKTELKNQPNASVGFMIYPIDQIADIVMVGPQPRLAGDQILVPVGADQAAILEGARDVARRFNFDYGVDVLTLCDPLIGDIGRLVGTDGDEKMSKSRKNTINLCDSPDVVANLIRRMKSNPLHVSVSDGANPDECLPFTYLNAFEPDRELLADMRAHYTRGGLADSVVKDRLLTVMNDHFFPPIRARRIETADYDIPAIIRQGTLVAETRSNAVAKAMRETMGLVYPLH